MNNNSSTHSSSTNVNGFGSMGNSQSIKPSSNYPIDQIPSNIDQETMEERVGKVINVSVFNIIHL